ncbi:hypothetical protein [Pandoraea terrigena]|uniref:Uncharacterized protein n=1 Tax=Pandoraea terrigena TaxID=2508292 RepID=A0A5E4XHM8_9BURK|nr:hypothetical protein [Pandoraea terrigena]VVE35732.1 hypothetical protein PTE31013_03914 [Pandoraea terrigena]
MNGNTQSQRPEIRDSLGAVVPGTGMLVGAGVSAVDRLTYAMDRAAEFLRDTFDVSVEKRYNSNGRSGGAFVITDPDARGIGSNSSIGISVGLTAEDSLRVNVYVEAVYLYDTTLATREGSMFGAYAYHPVGSVEEALKWIAENAKVPRINSDSV